MRTAVPLEFCPSLTPSKRKTTALPPSSRRPPSGLLRRASREQVTIVREFVWLQMLVHGMKTWGIAVSDAHAVHGNGVGGWRASRSILHRRTGKDRLGRDQPQVKDRADDSKLGTLSRVETSDGIQAGGLAWANGTIDLKVRVQCSSWIGVDRVRVWSTADRIRL